MIHSKTSHTTWNVKTKSVRQGAFSRNTHHSIRACAFKYGRSIASILSTSAINSVPVLRDQTCSRDGLCKRFSLSCRCRAADSARPRTQQCSDHIVYAVPIEQVRVANHMQCAKGSHPQGVVFRRSGPLGPALYVRTRLNITDRVTHVMVIATDTHLLCSA